MADAPRRTIVRVALLATAAILLAAVLPTPGSASPQTIAVTMRHSRFAPSHFVVRRGATVRFVITNVDPIDHELILGDETVQRRHETGTESAHGAVPGEVSVPAGMVAETSYTFSRAGIVLIGCHAPGHYNYGMRGAMLVVY
jgi:uncharacterized cupredoxin-like copper-binding protein